MSVQFEEQSYKATPRPFENQKSEKGIINFLVNQGFAKDHRTAEIILIFCTILFFVASAMILSTTFGGNSGRAEQATDFKENYNLEDYKGLEPQDLENLKNYINSLPSRNGR